jgi:nucleoside-diphosphate-sugar epimerase
MPSKLCIFGAGGPLSAAAVPWLKDDYELLLTDVRELDEVLEGHPVQEGAPLPERPEPPHEWRVVDIFDYGQVRDAAVGMDALINCSVVRRDPKPAFQVNVCGAYNVMKAAVECGVKRVIHTGPQHTMAGFEGDYRDAYAIPDEMPMISGSGLYAHTKHLADEIVRIFAEEHKLETISFRYSSFRYGNPPDDFDGKPAGVTPLAVSWEDAGAAFRDGLRAESLPSFFEAFHICAPMPLGKYSGEKAQRMLGWRPQHTLDYLYTR